MEVIKPDFGSSLNAMSDAFKNAQQAGNMLVALPIVGREMVQENADARYAADLNRYSNDPQGLANALSQGKIDLSNVSASALNNTQNTLANITKNRVDNYNQNQAELTNDYFKQHQADILEHRRNVASGNVKGELDQLTRLGQEGAMPTIGAWKLYEGDASAVDLQKKQIAAQNAATNAAMARWQAERLDQAAQTDYLLTLSQVIGNTPGVTKDMINAAMGATTLEQAIKFLPQVDPRYVEHMYGLKQRLLNSPAMTVYGYPGTVEAAYASADSGTPQGVTSSSALQNANPNSKSFNY